MVITKHAAIRSAERSTSAALGKDLFRKALKALRKGAAKEYPANGGKKALIWNGWRFITAGKTLVTIMPLNSFRPA